MRYRELDVNGDSTFCSGKTTILVNSPEAVAQAILTRLLLWQNEWYLNLNDGTPYQSEILGNNTQASRDFAIRQRILGTTGVTSIESYSSQFDPVKRKFTSNAIVNTSYGVASVSI